MINPKFTFSDVVYDTMSQADSNKLQVQNNCIKVCLKCDKLTPRHILYSTSGVKPLHEQRKEHTCMIVYKGLNQESTLHLNNMFTITVLINVKNTRSAIQGTVYIPEMKLKVADGNIQVRGL